MYKLDKFFIGGEWVAPDGDSRFPITNPATEEIIGAVAMGTAADVDRAVTAASEAFKTYSLTTKSDRLELLRQLLEET